MRGPAIGFFSALGVNFVNPSLGLWERILATLCFTAIGLFAAGDSL